METQCFEYRIIHRKSLPPKTGYIHQNPVAAGLVAFEEEYKYSSARFYLTGEDEFGLLTHYTGN